MVDKNILNSLAQEGKAVEGSSVKPGYAYHDIPIPGFEDMNSHRKHTASRVKHIVESLPDRIELPVSNGLDIGSSVGGISMGISLKGASMTGVDYDAEAVKVGNKIAIANHLDVELFHCEIDWGNDTFRNIVEVGYDFIVWLSQFMWVIKQQGYEVAVELLNNVSQNCNVMVFETAQHKGDGAAGKYCPFNSKDDVERMLKEHTVFENIIDCGVGSEGWNNRNVFVCY